MLDHMFNNLSWKLQSVSRNYQYFIACLSNNHGFIILKGKCAHLSAYRPYNLFPLADQKGVGERVRTHSFFLAAQCIWMGTYIWTPTILSWVGPPPPLFKMSGSATDPTESMYLDTPIGYSYESMFYINTLVQSCIFQGKYRLWASMLKLSIIINHWKS